MPQTDYSPYAPAAPYFDLVRHALGEAVEGEHFFDIIAPDIAYEVLYDFPGWPRLTPGREALMDAFRGYVQHIVLASTSDLVVHRVEGGRVFVLEYEVHGTILATGRAYHTASARSSPWRTARSRTGATTWIRSRRGTRSPPERTIFTRSCSPRATGLLC